ncbi:hypothetical protein [Prevotella intermedia]|uniref:hypothetical protein n=1 Tax=Prevotella intermedia TaxID=28131 RepID=UPI00138E393D|nr:hypothetical protein [Prevotella intermedia]
MELSFNCRVSLTFSSSIGTHSPLLKKRCSGGKLKCRTVGKFYGTYVQAPAAKVATPAMHWQQKSR